MYVINYYPTKGGHSQYEMYWESVYLGRSRCPLLAGSRKLHALGAEDEEDVALCQGSSKEPTLKSKIGVARSLTVVETEKAGPYFAEYVEPPVFKDA